MTNNLIESNKTNGFEMRPTNLGEAMELAKMIAESSIVPKDFKSKPGDVLVAIQMGAEVGLQPLQSIQSIAVINGRPTIWGDAALALVMKHPDFENIIESISEDLQKNHRASCTILRKGHEPYTTEFTVEDAKKAGLWSKDIWQKYPKRMLQMRARGFALRDKFPDALKGLSIREEVLDYEEIQSSNGISYAQEKKNNAKLTQADHFASMLKPKEVEDAQVIEAAFEEEVTIKEPEENKPFLSQLFVDQYQADKLKKLLKDDQGRLTRVLQWAGVEKVEDMPLSFYNATMDKLREEQGNVVKQEQQEKVA